MNRFHTAGVAAFLAQVAAVLLSPLALGYATKREALGMIVIAAVLQGITKGMQHGDTVLVPRIEFPPPD